MDSNGANLRLFVGGRSMKTDPTYSALTNRLAFISNFDGAFNIWVVNTLGVSIPQKLTASAASKDQLSMAPNGNRLAYIRNDDIYKINLTGAVENLVLGTNALGATANYNYGVAWAANDNLAVLMQHGDKNKLYTMTAGGTGLVYIKILYLF
jgi:Tol biopolymer transport system component